MSSQGPYVPVIAGVLVALVVAVAVLQGIVLSIESAAVGVGMGVLAGLGVGAVVSLAAGVDRVNRGMRPLAIAVGLFAWIALLLLFAISSMGVANSTALLAGVAVGALVGIGSYVYLREQEARSVNAVTMR